MGGKARRIRDNVAEYLTSEDIDSSELSKIYDMMTKLLVHDLEPKKFADMYAQTLVYGLFVARYGDNTPDGFTRSEARDLVPKSNPFLQHFFDHIVGPNFDTRLGYIVDELCEIFSVSNVQEIVHKHLRIQDVTNDVKDPIIHFYEDFLQEYDPKVRKEMGAYYTPTPVVKFIVRHVDKILREDFSIAKGLASDETFTKQVDIGQEVSVVKEGNTRATKTSIIDKTFHRVQLLDPAVGTATFLNETIKFIHEQFKGQEGRWPSYVADNLIHRLHGFELMMAPYTIAHLKLGMTLKETGVENLPDRLGVYLTNTLEEGVPRQQDLFSFGLAQAVSEESQHAAEIKSERPIMIVMGNPPYSGESSNNTPYANSLINKYKVEPGGQQKLQERNPKWLNDDYVKFIAFAENMVEKNGGGVVAMITNNGYLDNPTFRGMRWHLTKTFDKIYVLDLHGSTKKYEVAPGGGKDENVFDIMQGVGIILAVKTNSKQKDELGKVYRADIFGTRKHKFAILNEDPITWAEVTLDKRMFYFKGAKADKSIYNNFVSINDLFIINGVGITTAHDSFVISDNKEKLLSRFAKFQASKPDVEDLYQKFNVKMKMGWDIKAGWKNLQSHADLSKFVKRISYRPFDDRWIFYEDKLVWRPVHKVMDSIIDKENVALALCRQSAIDSWEHVSITQYAADDSRVSNRTKERGYLYPLYLYHADGTKTSNFNDDGMKELTGKLTLSFEPEDVFDYIYAALHSPSYRTEFKEFLKSDFPRVRIPTQAEFDRLVPLGRELRQLHLMKAPVDYETTFPEAGSNIVEKIEFKPYLTEKVDGKVTNVEGWVYINDKQYFGNVPETAWNFYIGGYQPAQKWLKDRKGRTLSNDDLDHYQKIIKILLETDRIMKEIDIELE
ncbi:DNA methyltransferase [Candidatus Saccharibacteria bacterium]|nr:DNA methyltransferase [Candidatus Saccharibacteria bacterium]